MYSVLQDHPLVTSSFTVNSTNTFDGLTQNATFAAEQLEEWKNGRTGELVAGPSNQLGWFRLPENSPIFDSAPDPSAGPTSAHYEFIFTVSLMFICRSPKFAAAPYICSEERFRLLLRSSPVHR